MKNAPCKGCQSRYKACHDSCTRYIEWRKWMDGLKAESQNVTLFEADKLRIENIRKTKRRYKLK